MSSGSATPGETTFRTDVSLSSNSSFRYPFERNIHSRCLSSFVIRQRHTLSKYIWLFRSQAVALGDGDCSWHAHKAAGLENAPTSKALRESGSRSLTVGAQSRLIYLSRWGARSGARACGVILG